jgi:hypothetical protein
VNAHAFHRASIWEVLDTLARDSGTRWEIKDRREILFFESTTVFKLYDVRALVMGSLDRSIAGLSGPDAEGITFVESPAEPWKVLDQEDLVRRIRDSICPESWESGNAEIRAQNGILRVRATLRIHEELEKLLASLRDSMVCQIRSRLVFIAYRPDPELSDADAAKLLEAAAVGRDAIRVASADDVSLNEQVMGGCHGREFPYIRIYDGNTANPIMDGVYEGLRYALKATAGLDRKTVSVQLRFSLSKTQEIRKISTEKGDVHIPSNQAQILGTARVVPVDQWVVLSRVGQLKGYGGEISQLAVLGRFEIVSR